ncbi:MAG: GIY-YIG nuclease family protein [Candidatus Gottesmanbacteria bacterium]
MNINIWYVYIIRCKDNSLYIGRTRNIKRRIEEHNIGNGSLYTKNKIPIILVYLEKLKTENEAYKREFQIKGWSRIKKDNLIKYGKPVL